MRYLLFCLILLSNIQLKAQAISPNNAITLYPNPTTELVNIQFSNNTTIGESIKITITDILGNKIKAFTFKKDAEFQFSMVELNAGIYLCKVETQNQTFVKRLFYKP